jgi:hypothetical protein
VLAPRALVIDTVNEGEVLGWSWLVPPYRYLAGARAVTPVSATALDGACLRGKCETDAELGYQLVKRVTIVMYRRQQSTRSRLLELYGWSMPPAPGQAAASRGEQRPAGVRPVTAAAGDARTCPGNPAGYRSAGAKADIGPRVQSACRLL